jgi:uncharacterized protein (TIGR03382 family)
MGLVAGSSVSYVTPRDGSAAGVLSLAMLILFSGLRRRRA